MISHAVLIYSVKNRDKAYSVNYVNVLFFQDAEEKNIGTSCTSCLQISRYIPIRWIQLLNSLGLGMISSCFFVDGGGGGGGVRVVTDYLYAHI